MPAELLDASAISHSLNGSYWRVSVTQEVTSTQDVLRSSNPKHGDVLVAEYQSAGRGRLDRSFIAEPSTALLFSFFLQPKQNRENWSFIPLIVGQSLSQVLNKKFGTNKYQTKWPNDILHENLKLSGSISEIHGEGVIVGVGINTGMSVEQLPVPSATSIFLIEGQVPNRNELLSDFLRTFSEIFSRWENGDDLRNEYLAHSATVDARVEVQQQGKTLHGLATGIDHRGALLLDTGEIVQSGDVVHLR